MSRSAISVTISLSKIITLANIVIFCFILNSSTVIALSGGPTTRQEAEENSKEIIKDVTGQEHDILQHVKYDYENHPREREIAWQYYLDYYLDYKKDYTPKIRKEQLGLFLYDLTGDGKQEIIIYINSDEIFTQLVILKVNEQAEHGYERLSNYAYYGFVDALSPRGDKVAICQPKGNNLHYKNLCLLEKDDQPIKHLWQWLEFKEKKMYDLKIIRNKTKMMNQTSPGEKEIIKDERGNEHEILYHINYDYENYPAEREIAWQYYLDNEYKYYPWVRKDQLGINLYDLNEDGKKEIILYIEANWCPRAGCSFDILQVDPTAKHGYRKLMRHGCGITPIHNHIAICQPADQHPLKVKSLCFMERDNKPIMSSIHWSVGKRIYEIQILK